MESLSSSSSKKLQTSFQKSEKNEDIKNDKAIKVHVPNPDALTHNIDPACQHFDTPISQREASKVSTVSLSPVKKKSLLKELGLLQLHCSPKADERKLLLNIKQYSKRYALRDKAEQATRKHLVQINLMETAIKLIKEEQNEEALRVLKVILDSVDDSCEPFIFCRTARSMAYTVLSCDNYIGSLKYFNMCQKHKEYIVPTDNIYFSGLYLGFDICRTKDEGDMVFPCFNPSTARDIIFKILPREISDSKELSEMSIEFPAYKPFIQGLIKIKNKMWDIREQLKELSETFSHDQYLAGFLCCIAAHELTNKNQYKKAEEMATEAGRLFKPFYKNYFIALISIKRKNFAKACTLLYSEFDNNEPVFKVLSQLLIETGNQDLAVNVFRTAATYFAKQAYSHECAYYNLRADLLVKEINGDDFKALRDSLPEPEAVISTALSDLQDDESESPIKTESSNSTIETDISSSPMEESECTTAKHTEMIHRQATPYRSSDSYYYKIKEMIQQFTKYSSDFNMESITDKLLIAITQYPRNLWLLHVAGWWHYECGNQQESKKLQLKGLQIALGLPHPFRLPANSQDEKRVVNQVVAHIKLFVHRDKKPARLDLESESQTELNFESDSRDVASFVSAYAHHLATDGLTEEASIYRNWADNLDTRRKNRACGNPKFEDQKINIIDQEAFNRISNC